jgi:hypothetical protein
MAAPVAAHRLEAELTGPRRRAFRIRIVTNTTLRGVKRSPAFGTKGAFSSLLPVP